VTIGGDDGGCPGRTAPFLSSSLGLGLAFLLPIQDRNLFLLLFFLGGALELCAHVCATRRRAAGRLFPAWHQPTAGGSGVLLARWSWRWSGGVVFLLSDRPNSLGLGFQIHPIRKSFLLLFLNPDLDLHASNFGFDTIDRFY
jgi:hypothetical protein